MLGKIHLPLVLGLWLLVLDSVAVGGSLITVRLDGGGDYTNFEDAIVTASDGDEVVVYDGVYTGSKNKNLDPNNKVIRIRSLNGPDNCIIDCENNGRGFIFQHEEGTDSVLEGITIQNGSVFTQGGGIYCSNSSPTIRNCIITNNTVVEDPNTPSLCYGAGISLNESYATIIDCEITSNSSPDNCFGGGIFCSGNPTIKNCVIKHNTTQGRGGGVCLLNGTGADIINCLIVENTASVSEYGGGIASKGSNPNIINCTISRNSAGRGGAIDIISATATITNSIIWDNSINEITMTATGHAIVSYSNVEGGYDGSGNINANPLFASPGDYHLTYGSPCIDTGTDSPPGGLEPNDLEGASRPFDGDLDDIAVTDMGAYEFHCNPGEPLIAITPAGFQFKCPTGGPNPNAKTLSIWNPGGGTLNWQITGETSWLQVNPASGQCTVDTDEVTISVDCNSLLPDLYTCNLIVSDNNNTRIIPVRFRVGWTISVPSDYNNIQAAIDAAFDGDMIIVADGTYTGTGNRDIDFRGKAITVRSENGPLNCIIDCQGSAASNHRGFYFHLGEHKDSALEGFTIIHGYYYEGALAIGGGIFCLNEGTSPTISNCIVTDNEASHGGGIGCYRSDPRIMNCLIARNRAGSHFGGGFYLWDSSIPVITGCTVVANSARFGGGGIYSGYNSMPQITNSILWDNNSTSGEDEIAGNAIGSYSDIEGGYSGDGNINIHPGFIDSFNGDYHILNNSPCIDVGDPRYSPEPNETDIDGQLRLMGNRIDMGSDEINDMLGDIDNSGDVSNGDLLVLAGTWLCSSGELGWDKSVDLDQDATITLKDCVRMAEDWGKERDHIAPSIPSNLTVTNTTVTTVSLSWDASNDNLYMVGYKIHRDGNYIGWTEETEYIDMELDPSTIYTYTVCAYDAVYNESAISNSCQAITSN